jgi:hypothetical protein
MRLAGACTGAISLWMSGSNTSQQRSFSRPVRLGVTGINGSTIGDGFYGVGWCERAVNIKKLMK